LRLVARTRYLLPLPDLWASLRRNKIRVQLLTIQLILMYMKARTVTTNTRILRMKEIHSGKRAHECQIEIFSFKRMILTKETNKQPTKSKSFSHSINSVLLQLKLRYYVHSSVACSLHPLTILLGSTFSLLSLFRKKNKSSTMRSPCYVSCVSPLSYQHLNP
jgi:hypothetical protein